MTTKINVGLIDSALGPRNVIINGNFDVWQRGSSFPAIATGIYSTDRIQYEKSGTMVHTVSRSTGTVPTYAQSGTKSNYSLHLDVTTADVSIAAGDYCFIEYNIEGYDYARIAGGDATLSFWVMAAKTGIHCVSFRNAGTDRSYVAEYTIVTADTWQKVELTIPLTETGGTWDYIHGNGLRMHFILASGSTFHTTKDTWQTGNYLGTSSQVNEVDSTANNFRIAQVQLERGSVATPYEFKIYADELARCQRYYVHDIDTNFHGYTTFTGQGIEVITDLPVQMRDTPTVVKGTATSLINCVDGNITVSSTNSKYLIMGCFTWTAVGGCRIRLAGSTAEAEL